jgi:hypothetical protein
MICGACGTEGLKGISELKNHSCRIKEEWARVMDLRREGHDETANRVARRLLGVKGDPMNEETKEKLRRWKEEHAEDIKAKQELKRQTEERLKAITAPAKGQLRRKVR